MSADKGGALVRSPPTIVDTYGTHVGANTGWDEHSPPHIPPLKTQQSQKNASVTKLPSGGYKDSKSKSNNTTASTSINKDSRTKSTEQSQDELKTKTENVNCACGGWSKARQMEYDLRQLQKTHEVILNGLHQQLDDMKQKNRDLTFQLLMGPFANSVKVEAPLSPESDATPPKETVKSNFHDEKKSPYEPLTEEKEKTKLKEGSNDQNISTERKHPTNQGKSEKVRSHDPRQAKSLDLELLEEESESLRKQLFDERARNKYLQNLAEDLKRQIREETGAWRPPPPPSSHKYNYNAPQSRINTSSDFGQSPNIFRLPHIDYGNDQKLNSIQEQIEQRELQKLQTQASKKRKEGSKHSERNGRLVSTTSLPAISKSGDEYVVMKHQHKGNKSEKSDYYIPNEHSSNKDQQHKGGAKNHSHSTENIYFPTREVTGSGSYEQQKEKYKQYGKDQYYDKRAYMSGSKSVHEVSNHYPENHHSCVEDLRVRETPRHSEIQPSLVKEQRRAQSPLRQRLYSEENSKPRNASRRKSVNEVSTFHSSEVTNIYETSSKSNGDFSLSQRISFENDDQKHGRKNSEIHDRISFGNSSQNTMSNEQAVNPSSSLVGTSPQSNSKGKHRGKNSKKGGKRNRKESQGTKEINE